MRAVYRDETVEYEYKCTFAEYNFIYILYIEIFSIYDVSGHISGCRSRIAETVCDGSNLLLPVLFERKIETQLRKLSKIPGYSGGETISACAHEV